MTPGGVSEDFPGASSKPAKPIWLQRPRHLLIEARLVFNSSATAWALCLCASPRIIRARNPALCLLVGSSAVSSSCFLCWSLTITGVGVGMPASKQRNLPYITSFMGHHTSVLRDKYIVKECCTDYKGQMPIGRPVATIVLSPAERENLP